MCKVCTECESIMNYDPYFDAEICVKCGKIERKKSKEIQKLLLQQSRGAEIARQILGLMAVH